MVTLAIVLLVMVVLIVVGHEGIGSVGRLFVGSSGGSVRVGRFIGSGARNEPLELAIVSTGGITGAVSVDVGNDTMFKETGVYSIMFSSVGVSERRFYVNRRGNRFILGSLRAAGNACLGNMVMGTPRLLGGKSGVFTKLDAVAVRFGR